MHFFHTKTILAVSANLFFIATIPANASLNSESPESMQRRLELAPEITILNRQIQSQPNYSKLMERLQTVPSDDLNLVCFFNIEKSGKLSNLRFSPTMSADIRAVMSSLIASLEPLPMIGSKMLPSDSIMLKVDRSKPISMNAELYNKSLHGRIGFEKEFLQSHAP